MVEIREAPVPVRHRWSALGGEQVRELWFHNDLHILCKYINKGDALTVEFSNGQTVIVRAKK